MQKINSGKSFFFIFDNNCCPFSVNDIDLIGKIETKSK